MCTSAASVAVGLVEDRPATALPTLAAVQASCAHKCAIRPSRFSLLYGKLTSLELSLTRLHSPQAGGQGQREDGAVRA